LFVPYSLRKSELSPIGRKTAFVDMKVFDEEGGSVAVGLCAIMLAERH
jgi:acyl-coenzyme A thioesterase PaaI-like protein